jgi:lipopolysaccharide/colanic/teichoic acid biosynthesis glycosyltransferase
MRLSSGAIYFSQSAASRHASGLPRNERRSFKRVVDIVGSLLALTFFLPLMIIIYMALAASGGSPVFAHPRIGRYGQIFPCFKFRSMVIDAGRVLDQHLERDPVARQEWARDQKLSRDPRVTRFGRFLRRSSIDELPQLFNVLRGEMSLVGPRPIVAAEVERYAGRIDLYCQCRPGLTGLWQVKGRNDLDYATRVKLDTYYARRGSLRLDVAILIRTVWAVVSCRGAR